MAEYRDIDTLAALVSFGYGINTYRRVSLRQDPLLYGPTNGTGRDLKEAVPYIEDFDPGFFEPESISDALAYDVLKEAMPMFGDIYPKNRRDKLWFQLVKAMACEFGIVMSRSALGMQKELNYALDFETAGPAAIRHHASNYGISEETVRTGSTHIWRLSTLNFGISEKLTPNAVRRVLLDFFCRQNWKGDGADTAGVWEIPDTEDEVLFEDLFDGTYDLDDWTDNIAPVDPANTTEVTGGNLVMTLDVGGTGDLTYNTPYRDETLSGNYEVESEIECDLRGSLGVISIARASVGVGGGGVFYVVGFARYGDANIAVVHYRISFGGGTEVIVGARDLPDQDTIKAKFKMRCDDGILTSYVDFGLGDGWQIVGFETAPETTLRGGFFCLRSTRDFVAKASYYRETQIGEPGASGAAKPPDFGCECYWKGEAQNLTIQSSETSDTCTIELWGIREKFSGYGTRLHDQYSQQPPVMERVTLVAGEATTVNKFAMLSGMRVLYGTRSGDIIAKDDSDISVARLAYPSTACGWFVDEPLYMSGDTDTRYADGLFDAYDVGDILSAATQDVEAGKHFTATKAGPFVLTTDPMSVGAKSIAISHETATSERLVLPWSAFPLNEKAPAEILLDFQVTMRQNDRELEILFEQTTDPDDDALASEIRGGLIIGAAGLLYYKSGDSTKVAVRDQFGDQVAVSQGVRTRIQVDYSIVEGVIRRLRIDGDPVIDYVPTLYRADGGSTASKCKIENIVFRAVAATASTSPDWQIDQLMAGGSNCQVRAMVGMALRTGRPRNAAYLHSDETDSSWEGPFLAGSNFTRNINAFFLGGLDTVYEIVILGLQTHILAAGVKLIPGPGDIEGYL